MFKLKLIATVLLLGSGSISIVSNADISLITTSQLSRSNPITHPYSNLITMRALEKNPDNPNQTCIFENQERYAGRALKNTNNPDKLISSTGYIALTPHPVNIDRSTLLSEAKDRVNLSYIYVNKYDYSTNTTHVFYKNKLLRGIDLYLESLESDDFNKDFDCLSLLPSLN